MSETYKIPVSVLVIIHDSDWQILLLERADRPGFWQSVTGSLDYPEEPLPAAAARELFEETGICVENLDLRDWKWNQEYEIFDHWKYRYAPGTTKNTEHVFSVEVPRASQILLSPREHIQYQWLDWKEAADRCFSWSNSEAIRKIACSSNFAG